MSEVTEKDITAWVVAAKRKLDEQAARIKELEATITQVRELPKKWIAGKDLKHIIGGTLAREPYRVRECANELQAILEQT